MPGLLYFLPSETRKLRREEVDTPEVGLGYAFDRNPTSSNCTKGPDGKPGMVLVSGDTKPGYYPERQAWRKIPGNPAGAWVGYYTDDPPKPADLARGKQLDGHLVELSDGNKWLIPKARAWIEEDGELRWCKTLPQKLTRNEKGEWEPGGPIASYARLWEIALLWDAQPTLPWDDVVACVRDVLAVNYAGLAYDEIELLGLIDTESVREILNAVIDVPAWEERIKKKLPEIQAALDGASTPDGATDSTPDTDQP